MIIPIFFSIWSIFALFFSSSIAAKPPQSYQGLDYAAWENDLPPRLQWNENFGYCGETSFISAGLYYGQYASQYTVRGVASPSIPQYKKKSQLLIGLNDQAAAKRMHLNAVEWNTAKQKNTPQFLAWVKKNVLMGYPVIIGVYTNEYLFYKKLNPMAGDPDYDHIVPVFGISSHRSLSDNRYYPDDRIYFSDNGLWGEVDHPYLFSYPFSKFQASRQEANSKNGEIYSLSNSGSNYGIAIKGVMDLNGDTLPVRITTNVNREEPEIQDGSNTPPLSASVILTITVSNLAPDVSYMLYRYNDFSLVPDSHFNAQAKHAFQSWPIQISSGTTFVMTQEIQSNEIAVYRAVMASAP